MKKKLLTLISIITFAFTLSAQNVNIPDANFKAYLLGRTDSINTDADKQEISISEAQAFNGMIDISSKNITSLVGFEYFINTLTLTAIQTN